ncbi:hypothetical protein ACJ5H2_19100 [Nocardioides sp. R1-1]|uniref:hypothetical protein n=1 Tax=Nocardioides sp. R1-1 TaxID=3383502 RepID=UPI0038CF481C
MSHVIASVPSRTAEPCGPPAVSVSVPRRWSSLDSPVPGVALLARAPAAATSGFTPELVLHTTPVDAALPLAPWREEAVGALAAQLAAFEVEDADLVDLDGEPAAYLRFSHRLGGVDVVCDQWAWLRDGLGVTLTCTVARADYADYCDLFEEVAMTVRLVPRAAA